MPRRFLIFGRVQGVFFRESTRKVAVRLGLSGHAINLPDGSVEVVASGDEQAMTELENWLWQGSPMARVDQVQSENIELQPQVGFRTG